MGLLNREVFVRHAMDARSNLRNELRYNMRRGYGGGLFDGPPAQPALVDRESALRLYNQVREYIVRHGYLAGKAVRPWAYDPDIYARLDRAQTWWGFEFETGYVSEAARSVVVSRVWDELENSCFDCEGEGVAGVEITFPPEEVSKYEDGTAQALKFMEILDSNPDLVMNGGNESVGTHINLSHPLLDARNYFNMAVALGRSVAAMEVEYNGVNARYELFGRPNLYGGFFANCSGVNVWIEGKLFRTTYKLDQFKKYLKTCHGISKCLDVLLVSPPNSYVTNFYEVVTMDAEPVIKTQVKEILLECDGIRGNNRINGAVSESVINGLGSEPAMDFGYHDEDYDDLDYYDDEEEEDY